MTKRQDQPPPKTIMNQLNQLVLAAARKDQPKNLSDDSEWWLEPCVEESFHDRGGLLEQSKSNSHLENQAACAAYSLRNQQKQQVASSPEVLSSDDHGSAADGHVVMSSSCSERFKRKREQHQEGSGKTRKRKSAPETTTSDNSSSSCGPTTTALPSPKFEVVKDWNHLEIAQHMMDTLAQALRQTPKDDFSACLVKTFQLLQSMHEKSLTVAVFHKVWATTRTTVLQFYDTDRHQRSRSRRQEIQQQPSETVSPCASSSKKQGLKSPRKVTTTKFMEETEQSSPEEVQKPYEQQCKLSSPASQRKKRKRDDRPSVYDLTGATSKPKAGDSPSRKAKSDDKSTCKADNNRQTPVAPPLCPPMGKRRGRLRKRPNTLHPELLPKRPPKNPKKKNIRFLFLKDSVAKALQSLEEQLELCHQKNEELSQMNSTIILECLSDLECICESVVDEGADCTNAKKIRQMIRDRGGVSLVSTLMEECLRGHVDVLCTIQIFGCMILQDLAYDEECEQNVVLDGGMEAPLRAICAFPDNVSLNFRAYNLLVNLVVDSSSVQECVEFFWELEDSDAYLDGLCASLEHSSQAVRCKEGILVLAPICCFWHKLIFHAGSDANRQRIFERGGLTLLIRVEDACRRLCPDKEVENTVGREDMLQQIRCAISLLVASAGWNNDSNKRKTKSKRVE